MVGHLRVSIKFAVMAHWAQAWRSRPTKHFAKPQVLYHEQSASGDKYTDMINTW